MAKFDGFVGFLAAEHFNKGEAARLASEFAVIKFTETTEPALANKSCRSFSIVLKERFPTGSVCFRSWVGFS